jgi:hypothetical protein
MTDLIGKTIKQYYVEAEIGRGGMATVYRARQLNINRYVAVKVLPAQFTHDPTFIERFNREVQMIAHFQHARILPVYDYGEFDGQPYIVMAYMPGGNLADLMRSEVLDLEKVSKYIGQIAEGLDYLHRNGIIHRDFKPNNVLLDKARNAFLADFGIARFQESTASTLTGEGLVGTPAYMAPEMYEKGRLSPSIDIYALGITLYQMLTGRLPFRGETPVKCMFAHLYEPIPNVLDLRPDLPPSIQRVLQTALAKDPTYRYPTAGDLARAFERAVTEPDGEPYHLDLLEPLPVAAPAEPPLDTEAMDANAITPAHETAATVPAGRATARRRRFPIALAIAGGVSLLGVAAGIVASLQRSGAQPSPTSEVTAAMLTEVVTEQATLTSVAEQPTATQAETAEPPASEGGMAVVQPGLGGGTGTLGFNAAGQGYLIDLDCVFSPAEDCSASPALLPTSGGITPRFGAWSPDGEHILFDDNQQVYVLNMEEGGMTPLTTAGGSQPAWSPSGQWVAFIAGADVWQADVACVESGGTGCADALTNTSQEEKMPGWSPDGNQVTYLQTQPSTFDAAFALNTQTGTSESLTPTGNHSSPIVWMPDGTHYLYINTLRNTGSTANTLFYDISLNIGTPGGGTVRLVTLSQGDFGTDCGRGAVCRGGGEFSLSQDGRYVALTFTNRADEDAELYLLDLACLDAGPETCQSSLVQITDNSLDERSPAWSPDGTWLAFVRARSTNLGSALDTSGRNAGTDVFILNVEQAWNGAGEAAVTPITSLGFVDMSSLNWQPSFNP